MPAVTSVNPTTLKTTVYDPTKVGMQPKPASQLPYVQDRQLLAVQPPQQQQAPQPMSATAAGNAQVMQAAQQQALAGSPQAGQTMGMVEQQTQGLLQNPNLISDQQVQRQVSQFDRNRADAMQAFQQQYADIANTGAAREAAYNFAMQGAQGRSDLENSLQLQQQQTNRQAMLDALGLGTSVAQARSGLDTDAFNRLISARGAYEPERAQLSDQAFQLDYLRQDQAGQQALVSLKGKIDAGLQASQQEFAAAQSALDRALERYRAEGDWASAEKLTTLKGQIDAAAQQAGFTFQAQQTLSAQQYQAKQADLDRELARYQAQGDWANAERITRLKAELDAQAQQAGYTFQGQQAALDRALTLQVETGRLTVEQQKMAQDLSLSLQGMSHEAQMAQLNAQIQNAFADRDVERQKMLMWYQSEVDAQEMERKYGYDSNLMRLDNQLKMDYLGKDIDGQKALAQYQATLEAQQILRDQGFEKTMVLLQSQIAEAKATNDVERQKTLMGYESTLQAQQDVQQYGYQVALTNLNARIDEAAAAKDYTRQLELVHVQANLAAQEAAKDRSLEEARIALQGRQIDMQGQAMTFDQIQAAVDAGQIDASAAVAAVQKAAQGYGIDIKAANPDAIYAEIQRDYRVQQYQWAMTHPDDAEKDAEGNIIRLKPEAAGRFAEYLNTTLYGPDGKPVVGGTQAAQGYSLNQNRILDASGKILRNEDLPTALRNADSPNNANNATYQQLVAGATTASFRIKNALTNEISTNAKAGDVVNIGGRLMYVASTNLKSTGGSEATGGRVTTGGRDHDAIELVDVATGSRRTFDGMTNSDNSVSKIDGWAQDLSNL